ncbi:MAG: phosphatase PAP2 family protein [Cytophagales bacterium]|nr:MAG: phosphatase PAP2 family protein [Cytophagales bacterium]TAF61901.1 MAG: phosphatase PAP2 family protein [Cytophagales bacterium]
MQIVKQLLKEHQTFFLWLWGYFFVGALYILSFERGHSVLLLNDFHWPWLDFIAKYGTHLGDGLVAPVLVLVLLFVRYYDAAWLALAFIIESTIVRILKQLIFSDVPRPKAFFDSHVVLNFVEGVEVHSWQSMPSGHTATAFVIFSVLAFQKNHPLWHALLCCLAIFAGLTRVYLCQHFFSDVYIGSVLGCVSLLIASYVLNNYMNYPVLQNKLALNTFIK